MMTQNNQRRRGLRTLSCHKCEVITPLQKCKLANVGVKEILIFLLPRGWISLTTLLIDCSTPENEYLCLGCLCGHLTK